MQEWKAEEQEEIGGYQSTIGTLEIYVYLRVPCVGFEHVEALLCLDLVKRCTFARRDDGVSSQGRADKRSTWLVHPSSPTRNAAVFVPCPPDSCEIGIS